jgi:copper chaperone CopZ
MTCGGCVAAVKVQPKRTQGVTAYDVSLEKAEAEVSYDPAKITPEKIAESVSKTGFKASVKKTDDKSAAAAFEGTRCGASCQRGCCKAPEREAAVHGAEAIRGQGSAASGLPEADGAVRRGEGRRARLAHVEERLREHPYRGEPRRGASEAVTGWLEADRRGTVK